MNDELVKGNGIEWFYILVPILFVFTLWGAHLYINVLPVVQGLEPIPEIYKTDVYNIWAMIGVVVVGGIMILLVLHIKVYEEDDEC